MFQKQKKRQRFKKQQLGTRPTESIDLSIMLKYRGAKWKIPKMGQQTSKSTTPTFDREVNSTEIRFNDPSFLQ